MFHGKKLKENKNNIDLTGYYKIYFNKKNIELFYMLLSFY